VSRGYFYFEIPWYSDLTTLTILRSPRAANEIRSRFKCILCCDTFRISSAHPSFAAVDTFCRAREQEVTKTRKSQPSSRQTQGNRAREQIANTPSTTRKTETSSTLSTASRVSQLSQCRQVAKDDLMLKLTLPRERKSSTVRMRANRYNIDHNRPGMRQAPWRDRYVTRVLARPLQPRAPQLFSSRYCCAVTRPSDLQRVS
jgi:hypothetical protein